MNGVLGIHHVTAIAADAQRTLDFYAGVLGLRFVKRTVNFDDPGTYHFYFGDTVGSPGSLLTFFPWPGARRGRQGPGQVAVTSLAVAPGAIGFWIERLLRYGIAHEGPTTRGPPRADAERVLAIKDRDGLLLEIVGHARAEGRPAWAGARGIPPEHAIHGLHAVTVWVADGEATERVLVESMGFRPVREDGAMRRFAVGDGGAGTLVDVRSTGGFPPAVERAGTVHTWRGPWPTVRRSSRCASGCCAPISTPRPSSTGGTSTRSISASPAASCSSWRPMGRGSPSTSRSSGSASG